MAWMSRQNSYVKPAPRTESRNSVETHGAEENFNRIGKEKW